MEISKRWRLARDKGWQEVEVDKRWRLARVGDWQEVEVMIKELKIYPNRPINYSTPIEVNSNLGQIITSEK